MLNWAAIPHLKVQYSSENSPFTSKGLRKDN